MLRTLEKRFGWLAVPHLTGYILAGQVLTFLVGVADPQLYEYLLLMPQAVAQGEVWRLFTFLFVSPVLDPQNALGNAITILFFLFYLMIFWMMGSTLEGQWGIFRYNLFILLGYVATVAAAFVAWAIVGGPTAAHNGFLYGSVFLAFAFLYPDYVFRLYGILPIKVKWLALLQWGLYAFMLVVGDLTTRLIVVASVANWFLFFWRDLFDRLKSGQRRRRRVAAVAAIEDEPFHTCVVCGKNDRSHPKVEFRYCNRCAGAPCYCEEHIASHEHR